MFYKSSVVNKIFCVLFTVMFISQAVFYFAKASSDGLNLTITVIDPNAPTTTTTTTTTVPSSTTSTTGSTTTTTVATTTTTLGGGGGGGGGGGINQQGLISTVVVLKGKAYPWSSVYLLKDAQIVAVTKAGPDANFNISLSGLSSGSYMFSLYSEDKNQVRSSLLSFPITITNGVTTEISGIFIAPTLTIDKKEVRRGDKIVLFGQSVPTAEIIITISSDEFDVKTKTDKTGIYLYNLDSSNLEIGNHLAKSRTLGEEDISPNSKTVSFLVGDKNVFNDKSSSFLKGDVNKDGKVNLVDFSIAAYWYYRSLSTSFIAIEKERLNGDKKVDLKDFSIIAFYWTG